MSKKIIDMAGIDRTNLADASHEAKTAIALLAYLADQVSPGFATIEPLGFGGSPDGKDAYIFISGEESVELFDDLLFVNGELLKASISEVECAEVPGAGYLARLVVVELDQLVHLLVHSE